MTKDEALKLAMEALKNAYWPTESDLMPAHNTKECAEAITAIREALAQPEQEPVAWMSPSWIDPDTRGWQSDSFESIPIEGWLPIYITPPQRTEPVCPECKAGVLYECVACSSNNYPPQRTWVGLTGEEIQSCWDGDLSPYQMQCIREIEAKLRELNA
jgi:hypothetical protein